MKRPLRIISMDGTRGAGKSSQIALLSKHLKSIGMTVSTLKMTDGEPIQSGLAAIDFCQNFLAKSDSHAVILDGSLARPMVIDIMAGMSNTNLMDKYKLLTTAFEKLDHQYDVAHFLLVMDDMAECARRIEKFKALTGQEKEGIEYFAHEQDIVSGMRFFNNHVASKNLIFQVLDLFPHQSMLEINKLVIAKLSEQYEFALPKRSAEDW
jgi:hypothetical protein